MLKRNDSGPIVNSGLPGTMPNRRKLEKMARCLGQCLGFLFKQYSKFLAPLFVSLVLILWFFGSLICFTALIFVILGVFLDVQDLLLYHPDEPANSRQFIPVPSTFSLPFENVYIPTPDGYSLHAYFMRQSPEFSQNVYTFVFFHGNAGNIGHRLENCRRLFYELGVNILLLEYRGFGKSSGSASEEGLYLDAETAVLYVSKRKDVNGRKIILFGRSLGGAVAIRAAASPQCAIPVHGLIVENTFTSIPNIGRAIFGVDAMKYIPLMCYKNVYPSETTVRRLTLPVMFVSGMADELVPPRMMKQLHEACPSQHKVLAQFPLGSHNDTWTSEGYFESIKQFLVYCDSVKKKTCTISL